MLGHLFQAQQDVLMPSLIGQPSLIGYLRMTFGQRACLVKHHRINLASYFQALRIFYEDAILRSLADAYHDGRWCGQSQSTRTSDDEHRNQSQEAMSEPVIGSQNHPCHHSHQGNRNDDRNKDGSYLIHQLLNRHLASLSILHHTDNLSQ